MDDLISRQAAIDALMSLTVYKSKREIVQAADKNENSWIGGVAECIDEIEDLPSAQPDIIRCKDCKHYKTEFCAIDIWTADVKIYKAKPDDFCSRAERRQDEQNSDDGV